MATIRVPQREHAIRMKQSLSIAKITSGAFKIEIIQDFGEETTLGHHIEIESKTARKENSPEHLRILRRIQSLEKCGRLNDNGGKGCDCSRYIAKGSLISESFSILLQSQKKRCQITPLSTIHTPPRTPRISRLKSQILKPIFLI